MREHVYVRISDGELDSALPAALRRYVTPQDWASLHVAIAEALYPAVSHNLCIGTFWGIWSILMVFSFLFVFLQNLLFHKDTHYGEQKTPLYGLISLVVLFVFIIVAQIPVALYRYCVLFPLVERNIQQTLSEFSKQSPGVSFLLMQDESSARRHIGRFVNVCRMLQISVDEVEGGYRLMTRKGATGNETNDGMTIEERLKRLEYVRHELSKDDYRCLRTEILNMN